MLFSGMACFSPSVPALYRKGWVMNGGTLTHSEKDFYSAQYFFCYGLDDPWLDKLLYRSLVVRHAAWIAECIEQEFIMPVGPYILDDDFDPSQIETDQQAQAHAQQQSAASPTSLHPVNPRKRTFLASREDDSYPPPEFEFWTAKRARVQENEDERQLRNEDQQHEHEHEHVGQLQLPSSLKGQAHAQKSLTIFGGRTTNVNDNFNLSRTLTAIYRPEDGSQPRPAPRPEGHSPLNVNNLEGEESPKLDTKHATAMMTGYRVAGLKPTQCNGFESRPRHIDLRVRSESGPSEGHVRKLNETMSVKPVSMSVSTSTLMNGISIGNTRRPPCTSTSTPTTRPPTTEAAPTHTAFWDRVRSKSGPVVLKISEIVRAPIDARLFVPGGMCYGERFGCVLLK